jgi:hypothetical protein
MIIKTAGIISLLFISAFAYPVSQSVIDDWKAQEAAHWDYYKKAVSILNTDIKKYDFSGIIKFNALTWKQHLGEDRPYSWSYLGYIGDDYQRLHIEIVSVSKKSDLTYDVKGKSKVKDIYVDFSGTLTITDILDLCDDFIYVPSYVDDNVPIKVKRQGVIIAEYSFAQNPSANDSGEFKGVFISCWYLNEQDKLFNTIEFNSDSSRNNQFFGNWTNYKTKESKTAAWGMFRIPPPSNDLDSGAGRFHPYKKYKNNGWQDYTPVD